ncbi:MAG: RNA-guided endonuclease IscB [Eubacteriales bacterium]
MVYVISKDGQPLMPTSRHGKVKHLLKQGKAKVIRRTPFTIQLLYISEQYIQPITLGIDAGSKTVGLSAASNSKEFYAAEAQLRTDIVDLLSTRRQNRCTRRNRKTRYRPARFNNRVKSKHKGWLAPSVERKVQQHLDLVKEISFILPIARIVIETAAFDIRKIKNPQVQDTGYQQGEQLDSWNVREYVLFRDNHQCRHCHGKSGDKVLNTHHLESRKTGGDAPNNLVTLCETCHKLLHKGKIKLEMIRSTSFRDAAFMGIMRWTVYNRLKADYPDVGMTYGYITKHKRIHELGEPKAHAADAFCIAGNLQAERIRRTYLQRFVRRHNRQIHKANTAKGGMRKRNQSTPIIKGFRLFDHVLYKDQECFIFGKRTSGYFDLRTLDGTVIHRSASWKQIRKLQTSQTMLIQ